MSDYVVTGKKGNGKSLLAVGIIRDALAQGKRVATNLDVKLDVLCRPSSRVTLIRVPDRPTAADLDAIGKGQDGVEEESNGVLVLDEVSSILNARNWADKSRQSTLDWLIHSRKHGWDTYMIAQGLSQIDKQVRETQLEYHIAVKRTDKWPIPLLSPLASMFGFKLTFPRMHVGIVKQGMHHDAFTIERKWFRAKDLYAAYNTQQIFEAQGSDASPGIHTVLSAWHIKGRYLPPSFLEKLRAWLRGERRSRRPAAKPKLALVLLLSKLPPHQRIRHWHRLNALGGF